MAPNSKGNLYLASSKSDAVLARRRAFHTSIGLAEIARTVRHLKASNLMAVAAKSKAAESEELEAKMPAESNMLVDENLPSKSATPTKKKKEEEEDSKALANKAVQLFDLFDGEWVSKFA